MNKFLIASLAVLFLAACEQPRTAQLVKTELDQVQASIKDLKLKELSLSAELDSLQGEKKMSLTKVRVLTMNPVPFQHEIEVSGAVEAKNSAYISPETGGQVKQIHVEEGQRVSKGQLLVSLNSQPMRSQLAELEGNLKLAEIIYEKQKTLWDQKIGSEVQYLEAKNGKESLENRINSVKSQIAMSEVKAPFNGIVDEIYSKVGEMASPGQRLLDFVSLSGMEINAEVSESLLQSIKVGDKVAIVFPNMPEANALSSIDRKGHIINPANRTFKISITIPNKDERIKPNQIAAVKLKDYQNEQALVVPAKIIGRDLKGDFVFLARERDGALLATKTYVNLGYSFDGNTEIVKGLQLGDRVLTEGFNLVRNGSHIEIVQ